MRWGIMEWFHCETCVRTAWLIECPLCSLFSLNDTPRCSCCFTVYITYWFLLPFTDFCFPLLALYFYTTQAILSSEWLDLYLVTTLPRLFLILTGYLPWSTHTTLLHIFVLNQVLVISDPGRVSFWSRGFKVELLGHRIPLESFPYIVLSACHEQYCISIIEIFPCTKLEFVSWYYLSWEVVMIIVA